MEKGIIRHKEFKLQVECPYCKEENEINVPDLFVGEDKEECWNCNKKFIYEFDYRD